MFDKEFVITQGSSPHLEVGLAPSGSFQNISVPFTR